MKKSINNLAIKTIKLSKKYRLHCEKPTLIENVFGRGKREIFVALDGVDLEIKKREKIGVIGANGSGKTTLFKLISGITTATSGRVKTYGRIVSLIDLSAGFHPELTGRENIELNGLLIGMSKEELNEKYNKIIDFAGVGNFIDSPLYTYSEGMKLRLGFAIAIMSEPDILILDEGIMAGDKDFQEKSGRLIEEYFKNNKTILVATHWTEYLKEHCRRIIWLDKGKIRADGNISVLDNYEVST